MTAREQLIAYLATLGALVLVFAIAVVGFGYWPQNLGKAEAFGLGTITGGLIGVLRIPSARGPAQNVENAETVNQGTTP